MKKVFLLILFSFIFFTSCERVWYEDLVPSESEYASWDGNYFYYGNYRSKSTGMDEEQLVSEVVIDEKKYKVEECIDYRIYSDDVYMLLELKDDSGYRYSFVIYNIKIKEVMSKIVLDYIFDEEEIFRTIDFNQEKAILEAKIFGLTTIFDIDFNNFEYKEVFKGVVKEIYVFSDYIVFVDWHVITYCKFYEYDFKTIYNYPYGSDIVEGEYYSLSVSVGYTENENGDYLRILVVEKVQKQEEIKYSDGIYYYDLTKDTLHKLLDYKDGKDVVDYFGDYIIIGDEYNSPERENTSITVNNILYKLDFDSNVTLEEVYNFNDSKKEYHITEIKEEIIEFNIIKFDYKYRVKYETKYFDLNKHKFLYIVPEVFEESSEYQLWTVIYFDDGVKASYVLEYRGFREYLMEREYNLYYLYRIDDSTNEKKLIQFYSERTLDKGSVMLYEMFFENYPYCFEFGEEYFRIRNY